MLSPKRNKVEQSFNFLQQPTMLQKSTVLTIFDLTQIKPQYILDVFEVYLMQMNHGLQPTNWFLFTDYWRHGRNAKWEQSLD